AAGAPHGEVLRYDTTADFTTPASWGAYDPGANGVGTDPDGYTDVVFDGRHLYFVPWDNGTEHHGEVLRYDTDGDFTTSGSWSTFDPGANGVGSDPDGYIGATFDGRYLYFTPLFNGTANHGEVLRYDTTATFVDPASWAAYDAGANGVGVDADGYEDAEFDGRYVYFAPTFNGTAQHGEVLRFDTLGSFTASASWSAFDPGANAVGTDPDGYVGLASDGRHLYFTPSNNGTEVHGEFLRYDTQRANQGTLRQFIENSNAAGGTQTSNFEIPTTDPGHSSGTWTIDVAVSELPLVFDGVTLDATTQPGWSGDPVVELDHGALAAIDDSDDDGFGIFADGTEIRGFAVTNVSDDAIYTGNSNVTIAGNWVGLSLDGTLAATGNTDIFLFGSATNVTIGGAGANDGNRIAAAGTGQGLFVSDTTSTRVEGNVFGLLPDGITSSGPPGVLLTNWGTADGTVVHDNVFAYSGSGVSAIDHYSTGSLTITANAVGLDEFGGAGSIGDHGVFSFGDGQVIVGGVGPGDGNTFRNLQGAGVTTTLTPRTVSVLGNSIVGSGELAIDLDDNGVTANDAGDADTGPNDLLNFPEITAFNATTIDFDLDVPSGDYLVEAFRNPSGNDPSGFGEAEVSLGTQQIAHTGSGVESFTEAFTGVTAGVDLVLAITECTNPGCTTFGATSELSLATPSETD
ncbi:MAG: hypothetical protein AAGG08_16115, partial [Actinomycetota bacterium]